MAKTLVVVLTCDRCVTEGREGAEGTESVSFGYDGFSYSLDPFVRPRRGVPEHGSVYDQLVKRAQPCERTTARPEKPFIGRHCQRASSGSVDSGS